MSCEDNEEEFLDLFCDKVTNIIVNREDLNNLVKTAKEVHDLIAHHSRRTVREMVFQTELVELEKALKKFSKSS